MPQSTVATNIAENRDDEMPQGTVAEIFDNSREGRTKNDDCRKNAAEYKCHGIPWPLWQDAAEYCGRAPDGSRRELAGSVEVFPETRVIGLSMTTARRREKWENMVKRKRVHGGCLGATVR